ncbi:hypothetical protein [Streptomyces sp. HNM0574]|uniref:hypothetical protein n=1 Tax=Streptomyces sp. HNM0574 TaxID=2714954 RepID=UPI00146E413E|nr:hypothetical protein [Streptomyces sp. HNM0574]NLU66527.1 hypothetical protein [Streptomyces sp. HNM0574]
MEAVIVLVFFGVVYLVTRKYRAKRSESRGQGPEELKALAESRGWTYERNVPRLIDEFGGAGPLPVTKGVAGGDVVSGTHRGSPFRAFEHSWSTSSPTSAEIGETHADRINCHSVWAMELNSPAPEIRILNRTWHQKLKRGTPLTTGIPRFDDNFHITAEDEAAARTLLHGDLGQFLLNDGRFGDLQLEIRGNTLITWRTKHKLTPETLDAPLDFLADVVEHLPARTP